MHILYNIYIHTYIYIYIHILNAKSQDQRLISYASSLAKSLRGQWRRAIEDLPAPGSWAAVGIVFFHVFSNLLMEISPSKMGRVVPQFVNAKLVQISPISLWFIGDISN